MNDFVSEFASFSDFSHVVTFTRLSSSLLACFILALIAAKTYQVTLRRDTASDLTFPLVLCSLIAAAVTVLIGNSLVLFFVLIVTISLIQARYKNLTIKDAFFLFMIIILGIACGAGLFSVALAVTLITCLAALAMSTLKARSKA